MTEVLAVALEIYPLVKTGGLADVAGALPAAVKPHGISMRTLVPGYPAVMKALQGTQDAGSFDDLFGGAARIRAGTAKGLELFVLDAPHLYDRPGNPYLGPDGKDWPDNFRRFAALSFAAAELSRGFVPAFAPSVVHAHDWQGALAPAYIRYGGTSSIKSVLTIHNLAFQGLFPAHLFGELGLPPWAYSIDGLEYYGGISFLKGGLQCADAITTVSPSYAQEIRTPSGGMGLDGLLRARGAAVSGIVNGIDLDVWNPSTDTALKSPYDANRLGKRADNKRAVEQRFSLERDDGILFCVISRLTSQKGLDLLASGLDRLVAQGARLALLGSGDAGLEAAFGAAAGRHRGRVGTVIGYDEGLSHLVQGGSDAILVPSRFEPCGLTQLYGLRYGCVPVVARIGGLADTIIDANDAALSAGVASGIQFAADDQAGLDWAITRAISLYRDKTQWSRMQKQGMKADVGWERSAGRYAALYKDLATS